MNFLVYFAEFSHPKGL